LATLKHHSNQYILSLEDSVISGFIKTVNGTGFISGLAGFAMISKINILN
jgi:hypothetical protein